VDFEDRCTLQDSLVVCRFYRDLYLWDGLATIIRGTTGMDLDREGLKRLAMNIRNAAQRFNLREGLRRQDDTLSPRLFAEPLDNGQLMKEEEFNRMIDDYYSLRGWDDDGIPR
jgi:aldehyde:ferredoxin oxidoreductase